MIWLIIKARCWKWLNGVKLSFFYKDFTSNSQANGLIFPDLHWALSSKTKLGFWGKIAIWRMDLWNVPKPVIFYLINLFLHSLAQSKLILIWEFGRGLFNKVNEIQTWQRFVKNKTKKYYEWKIFPSENLKLWLTFERNEISHKNVALSSKYMLSVYKILPHPACPRSHFILPSHHRSTGVSGQVESDSHPRDEILYWIESPL